MYICEYLENFLLVAHSLSVDFSIFILLLIQKIRKLYYQTILFLFLVLPFYEARCSKCSFNECLEIFSKTVIENIAYPVSHSPA